jgi:hypothetical protein
MGTAFTPYSTTVKEQKITGKKLADMKPAAHEEFFRESLKIDNPLHRIVLITKLKTSLSPVACAEDEDSPHDVVDMLQELGPEYTKYGPTFVENCVGLDLLAKLKVSTTWKAAFEGLAITSLLHQNIIYNRVMDKATERNKKRKLENIAAVKAKKATPAAIASPQNHTTRSIRSSRRLSPNKEEKKEVENSNYY